MMGGCPVEGGRPSVDRRHGAPSRARWVSSEPTLPEVEDLCRRFPEVVRLPAAEVRAEEEKWSAEAVVLKSLGRRVAAEAVAREFRLRAELRGEVAVMAIDAVHFVARFLCSEDRDRVLRRPWVISGQLVAVERWTPRFRPSPDAIASALVWLRLPLLPVELWGPETLNAIASFAGDVVLIDEWTLKRSRGPFAKVCVRLDLSSPLRPGVIIDGPAGGYWQSFVYEHAGGVCLGCGRFHTDACPCSAEASFLSSANVAGGVDEAAGGRRPLYGSWLVAVKQWLPRSEPGVGRGLRSSQSAGAGESAGPAEGRPDLSPPSEGWSKPAKLARRGSPQRMGKGGRAVPGSQLGTLTVGRFEPLQAFQPLTEAGGGGLIVQGPVELSLESEKAKAGILIKGQQVVPGDQDLVLMDRGKSKIGLGIGTVKRQRSPVQLREQRGQTNLATRASISESGKGKGRRGKAVSSLVPSPPPQAQEKSGVARGDESVFTFSAGGPGGVSAAPVELATSSVLHEEVVGRLRQAMQTEEDVSIHQMVEGAGLEEDEQGIGASTAGPSRLTLSS